jgi:hypothetical protein
MAGLARILSFRKQDAAPESRLPRLEAESESIHNNGAALQLPPFGPPSPKPT